MIKKCQCDISMIQMVVGDFCRIKRAIKFQEGQSSVYSLVDINLPELTVPYHCIYEKLSYHGRRQDNYRFQLKFD